ncbi:hypothetical protein [Cupriavidus plantarum]|uniref:hypothetical protein n=1 Tax=Cupriavidus plantarum TaxID=942865 RepID=UPI001B1B5A74|nr:hypothetical protein [Cupriavidus plantarum]CAG2144863.1 hypothetical protein LMG26296_03612 [Cupriavidus plantarum]SMR85979.1 hypothetical protein SAMN05421735_4799 [Cupriavidus plantarum]
MQTQQYPLVAQTPVELNKEDLQRDIASKLQELGAAKVVGAKLAPIVAQVLPAGTIYKNYLPTTKTPRLKDFVELYLSDLIFTNDERQGTDIVYELRQQRSDSLAVVKNGDGMLWKSFVALSPSRKLVFDTSIGEIGTVLVTAQQPAECVEIRPVQFEEHREMCERFVAKLGSEHRDTADLAAVVENFDEQSYPLWLKALRTSRPPLDKEWGKFRQDSVLKLFHERLIAFQVSEDRIAQLKVQLERDRGQAQANATGVPPATAISNEPSLSAKELRERRARELLHAAVDKMSYEQIQKLEVPFGVLLDLAAVQAS